MVRFAGAAVLLLIPTTLMGATLPLLARHFVMRPWELRRSGLRIGTLYAVNLFGAVAGAFFAGFVFLPLIGVTWTNVTAASFNLTLAAAIVVARRRLPDADKDVAAPTAEERSGRGGRRGAPRDDGAADRRPRSTARARRAVLAAFAVSGATAMTLQVLWTRALAVLLGSSVFSFTLILLAFLIGLGVGAAVFARLGQRTPHPGPVAGGAAPRDRRRGGRDLPVHRQGARTSSPGCCSRPASASTRSSSASSCSPASRCCRRRC